MNYTLAFHFKLHFEFTVFTLKTQRWEALEYLNSIGISIIFLVTHLIKKALAKALYRHNYIFKTF